MMEQLYYVVQEIEKRQFQSALDLLANVSVKDHVYHGMHGVIYFLTEKYDLALKSFLQAHELDPEKRWKEHIDSAKINLEVGLEKHVPEPYFFTTEFLQNLYVNHGLSLQDIKRPFLKKKHPGLMIRNTIGSGLGLFFSLLLTQITNIYGMLVGYKDTIWTNWYRKPMFTAVLSLAYMRNFLNKNNLYNTYSEKQKKDHKKWMPAPDKNILRYRTLNGTYNNPENPLEGAAGTRFQRNISHQSSNLIEAADLLSPNPRMLSRVFLSRLGPMKEAPFINMLAAAWIQFQNHDWISHGEPFGNEVIKIPIAKDDIIYQKYHQTDILVGKTQYDITRDGSEPFQYTFLNEVTHWWDASQLYGSDEKTCRKLRTFQDGKLRLDEKGCLPLDQNGIEMTGYSRNWWVGLSLFHTLFVREHNSICNMLSNHYSSWNDEDLFHTARLINSALIAKIHTLEWNSAINPNKFIYSGNHSNWYGFLTTLLRSKKNWKTVADINVNNTELGGVVGNPIQKFGKDFGLTQEFVEAYRIHSMLPENLIVKSWESSATLDNLPFNVTRQSGSAKCIQKYGMQNLIYSLGCQNPGQVVLNNYPAFMQNLSIPGNPVYDMGAVDILRARERGVPRYNEFRRQMGLNPIQSYEDLTSDQEVISQLKTAYGSEPDAVEKIDFMIGTLAEDHRPEGFAFGETMFQLFLLNATRRLQSDRFFTDCYNETYYTKEGMAWIDSHDLKSVLLRHYPALNETGLKNVQNAFEPWDDFPLDAKRHPLQTFTHKK